MNELLMALREVDSMKTAHDEAMHKCVSSWGYVGYAYICALEKSEKRFADALNSVIDARIQEQLKK